MPPWSKHPQTSFAVRSSEEQPIAHQCHNPRLHQLGLHSPLAVLKWLQDTMLVEVGLQGCECLRPCVLRLEHAAKLLVSELRHVSYRVVSCLVFGPQVMGQQLFGPTATAQGQDFGEVLTLLHGQPRMVVRATLERQSLPWGHLMHSSAKATIDAHHLQQAKPFVTVNFAVPVEMAFGHAMEDHP